MSINDPSNHVGKLLEWSGGGWGYVFVVAGLVIGGIVGPRLTNVPPKGTCVSEYVNGVWELCARVIEQPNLEGALNAMIGGAVLGGMVGLVVYLAIQWMRKPAAES